MAWNDGITGSALQIAEINTRRLRVMAGPGTGKSFAMKRRVQRLLEEGADPSRILAITFTRVAARALVKELRELGVAGCENIKAGTLHSYCFSILSNAEVFHFSGRSPRPLFTFNKSGNLQFEAAPLIQDIQTAEYGNKRDCAKKILAFEAAWARLQSDNAGWPGNPVDASFHESLLDWLKFHEAMLIGEVVSETLRYLRTNPTCPELSAFDHVIVDEYQDLNKADQELIELLSQNAQTLIIGDEDQSIYGFRHAHPDGIKEYNQRNEDTHDESLDECRRCPKRVTELACNLINRNYPPGHAPRLQQRDENSDGEVYITQWGSPDEEAVGIGKFVKHLITNRGYHPFDILILTPRRKFGYQLRDYLVKEDVPAHSFFKEELLEPAEAQRAFCLLTLLLNPDDRVALRFWLGYGHQIFNTVQYKVLKEYCEGTGFSPREALTKAIEENNIKGIGNLIVRFQELQTLLTQLSDLSLTDVINELFPEAQEWAKPIREIALARVTPQTGIQQLHTILSNIITQPDMPEEGEFVKIMSLHGSKGLTSKVVIVIGCVEGLTPTISNGTPAEQAANLKEQRRLFYVAITRPTEILVLSSFASIGLQLAHQIGVQLGGQGRTITSRFINELGPNQPASVQGTDWENVDYTQ